VITIDTVTRTQVRELAAEAAEAGDLEMVRICERALAVVAPSSEALQMCCNAINAASALIGNGGRVKHVGYIVVWTGRDEERRARSFDTFEKAGGFQAELEASGIGPDMIEIVDHYG
jgi:hypothetical protein